MRTYLILALLGGVLSLPFLLQPPALHTKGANEALPTLIVITPHNEAIRREFAHAFSQWHQKHYACAVDIDWRVLGGTTEITRYLIAEYSASAKRFLHSQGLVWPRDASGMIFAPAPLPHDPGLWQAYRSSDAPQAISCGMDLFFGGGVYDHAKVERMGITCPAWPQGAPAGLFEDAAGRQCIPHAGGGETWCGQAYYGAVLSSFGICYNRDRLRDLGFTTPPKTWADLADPRYLGQLGLSDPMKSGSVAKAFEMIIHEQCALSVARAGFTPTMHAYEEQLRAWPPATPWPATIPAAYQEAVAQGWLDGLLLVQKIAANARYFTNAASKVPTDVGMGNVAAGVVIDFFGRLQEELTTPTGQQPVVAYVTPQGGSCVSADPISLLRGAPNRALAVRFIEFVLGSDGQRLWNYRVGTPGGPQHFALRRLPIRREFYPSTDPQLQAQFEEHRPFLADPLWEPNTDAYHLSQTFHYYARWTARHFDIQRILVRAMCVDSADELKQAWQAIQQHGGPHHNPEAIALLEQLPSDPPLTWHSALEHYAQEPTVQLLNQWTGFFRNQYHKAARAARAR